MKWFDDWFERSARKVAFSTSRRSTLARLGKLLVAGAVALPVLPFDRVSRDAHAVAPDGGKKKAPDETQCEYWRYCALDGFLCSCCGGSMSSCPPGTEMSKVAWIGTCRNPADGKDYLVSYNDCCGKNSCGRCLCNFNLGDRPAYRMGLHNDINWCMANTQNMFHCTTSVIIGLAEKHS
ncbi:methylamine dehydrogenase light chain [Burkholderiales bacterium]|nr:MAG: amine dehydrogenase [Burkholderiales bacterium]CAG0958529.1 methylamine dehydrogenase light chain [Burkholderiales bacterium]